MMKARLFALLSGLALLLGISVSAPMSASLAAYQASTLAATDSGVFPRTVKDGSGAEVTIASKPVRIVSGALVTDEILLSLIEPSRLAAVTANAEDEAQSNVAEAAKPIQTKLAKIDPEAIVALKPDLVFVTVFTDAGTLKQLKDADLPIFLLTKFDSIQDIENNILLVGQAVGAEGRAAELVSTMQARLAKIADAIKDVKPQKTVIYYGPSGYSVGANTTINEVITRAGGINAVVTGQIKDLFPQLSDEFMIKADPDVVLLAGFNSYAPGFVENFMKNPAFQTLKALKNKTVYVVNDAHVAAVSQSVVEGVVDVAALLYPDRVQLLATLPATQAAH